MSCTTQNWLIVDCGAFRPLPQPIFFNIKQKQTFHHCCKDTREIPESLHGDLHGPDPSII